MYRTKEMREMREDKLFVIASMTFLIMHEREIEFCK